MISAPSSSACWAACWAPGAVPASSFTRSWTSRLLNSASAISDAFFMDCAATAALPLPDSGRIRATLTLPAPTAVSGWAGAGAGLERLENRSLGVVLPVQPDSTAPAQAASTASQRGTAPARDGVLACDLCNMRAVLPDPDLVGVTPPRQFGIFS